MTISITPARFVVKPAFVQRDVGIIRRLENDILVPIVANLLLQLVDVVLYILESIMWCNTIINYGIKLRG